MTKPFRVPSLQALQAFVEVARCGNFTEAAARLCLTQSAVSRKIQQLEGHYDAALLLRNSRGVSLTEAGRAVLDSAERLLEELQALERRLQPKDTALRIRIHVSLAVRWLLPRLTDFYARHPNLALSIETVASQRVDPSGDCDACILYLPNAGSDPGQHVLFEEVLIPVCAPQRVDGKTPPSELQGLADYPLIHGSPGHVEWASWLAAQGRALAPNTKHITFNLDELALDAASRGLGVAMTDRTLAAELIERGDLIVPFGPALVTGGVYVLWLQPSAASHPSLPPVLEWFARQALINFL